MTSKVIWSDIFTGVIEVIKHHMPISHSPCRRRYIGPLPSCCNMGRGDEAQGNQFKLLDFNLSLVVFLLFLPSSNYVDSSVFTDPL